MGGYVGNAHDKQRIERQLKGKRPLAQVRSRQQQRR